MCPFACVDHWFVVWICEICRQSRRSLTAAATVGRRENYWPIHRSLSCKQRPPSTSWGAKRCGLAYSKKPLPAYSMADLANRQMDIAQRCRWRSNPNWRSNPARPQCDLAESSCCDSHAGSSQRASRSAKELRAHGWHNRVYVELRREWRQFCEVNICYNATV